ncbi:hypothetical protein DOTSEDRAFT_40850 [Dothistroma septosporum NZE10]|uniref:Palmitoyltransferase n=1 Tax=Dothistroma septosporum (strain NZE10 / CBS 128990) TaxID=675120 RepID=N1Q1T0_DOTSN|nr:hypothetical protein DOTSEDRAFT_40850 [Dothistroma septosporum NZE10]
MGVLRNIAIAVFVVSLVTFVALFGRLPALRRTPIGWLQRLLCLHLPHGFRSVDRSLTGGQITHRSRRLGQYLFYEKNPVVLIIFLGLLSGSAVLFLWNTANRLPARLLAPIPPLLALPYVFTYLCVTYQKHYISADNHRARMTDYPYDHILFRPQTTCRTCNTFKPARSKHCSFCGFCVAKCDHHCPWVNNCLGRGNYRHFLALLITLGVLQIYGAYLSWWLMQPYFNIDRNTHLFSWGWIEQLGHDFVTAVHRGGISIAGVGLLAASTAPLPLGLLAYHLYLIWAGMTTNESQKWSDWKDDMVDGHVFKASRDELRKHNQQRGALNGMNGHHNPALDPFDEDPVVYWPLTSDSVLVRTRDGRAPQGQEHLWARVWALEDVDNVYDIGGLGNFLDVLYGK